MDKSEAIRRAGGTSGALGRLLGITGSAVRNWPDGPIPELQRYKLKELRPWWFRKPRAKQDRQTAANAVA